MVPVYTSLLVYEYVLSLARGDVIPWNKFSTTHNFVKWILSYSRVVFSEVGPELAEGFVMSRSAQSQVHFGYRYF